MTSSKIAKKPNRLQRQSLQEILRQLSIASNILLESRASIILNNILANSSTSIGNTMDGIASDSNGHPMEIVIQSGNKLWRIHPPTQQQLSDLSLSEIDLTNNFLQMLTTSTTSDSSARPSLEIKDNGIINLAKNLSSGDCIDAPKAKEEVKVVKVLRHQDTECKLDDRKVSVKNVSTDCIQTQVENVAIEVQVSAMEGIPEFETKDIKKNLELMSMILRSKNVGVYKKDAETLCDIFWKIPEKDDSTTTNTSTYSQTEKQLLVKSYLEKDASVTTVGNFHRYWNRFRKMWHKIFRPILPKRNPNFITLELETSEEVVSGKSIKFSDFHTIPKQKQIMIPAIIPNKKEIKPVPRDLLETVRQTLVLDGHSNQKHLKDIIEELTKQREDIAKISLVCATVMKTQKDHDDANKYKKIQTENSFFQHDKCVSSKSMWSLGRKNQCTNVSVQDICPRCNKKKRPSRDTTVGKDADAVCSLYKRTGTSKKRHHHAKSERSKGTRGHYEGDNNKHKKGNRVKDDIMDKVKMLMDPGDSSLVLKLEKELKNIDLRKRSREKCNCKLESSYSLAKRDAWVMATEKTNKLKSKFSFFRRHIGQNL